MGAPTITQASLHFDDPGVAGLLNELTDSSYSRQSVSWGALTAGVYTSDPAIFHLSTDVAVWAGLWNGATYLGAVDIAAGPGTFQLVLTWVDATNAFDTWEPDGGTAAGGTGMVPDLAPTLAALESTDLDQTPIPLTVVAVDGPPNETVTFYVGSTNVATPDLDMNGVLPPTSIPIPPLAAGSYTLDLVTSGGTTSVAFTVARDADTSPYALAADADPVLVDDSFSSTGVHRWVLQDLAPGGLGSYVLPRNPVSAQAIPFDRNLVARRTADWDGAIHIGEPIGQVHDWSFTGYYRNAEEQAQLEAYAALNRRLYVIDHRQRAWTVAITDLELVPRKRIADDDGAWNDQTGDYVVHCALFSTDWKTPA